MPAAGKNSRGVKRGGGGGSSAASSYISSITLALFVGFCLVGVYMLSSSRTGNSSIIKGHQQQQQPHKPHQRVQLQPRSVLRDQTAYSATEDEMPEDEVSKGAEASQETQQQPEEEQNQSDEQQSQEDAQRDDAEQSSDAEQQQQQNDEQSNEEQQQQSESNNQDEAAVNDSEQQQQSQEETQEQSTDVIEQVTDDGITSQSQVEHDSDGTTENQQQQQQQEEDQQPKEEQQQEEQKEEEVMQQEPTEEQQQQQQQKEQQKEQKQEEGESASQQTEENPSVSDSIGDDENTTERKENTGDSKTWATQASESSKEKERRKEETGGGGEPEKGGGNESGEEWALCNVTAGPDYIPCLDNEKAIKQLHSLRQFQHRERHCPEESPTCLVPLPTGYKHSIQWPQSRDRIWYSNVPHTKLAEVKGHQNWVKVEGDYLTFPGGGTQFIHGALHYIDFIQQAVPEIAWGKHTRVILDVGCGVASFGGYLFERDVLALSFAPKDEHEAQVQFALERGIPAFSAVMGSQRLPFPSRVFDVVHCARCRVPWHANDGALLLELNRVLRPGGYFVWSATPVYQKLKEDVEIWEAMTELTKSMCWDLVTIKKDELNQVGAAMYRKPTSNECYEKRKQQAPPLCKEDDDPNAAWYVPLQSCMHRVPVDPTERGTQWPKKWPARSQAPPYWLNKTQTGIYGKPAPEDFTADYEHWQRVVQKSYLTGFGIDWSKVRNVMDMRAAYGGFAAALRDMKLWVMNLVNIDAPDTLPIIYERGLFGMYHDWCESFSTYPRTYDLLHADHLFSQVKKRCKVLPVVAEVDRIVRPGGKIIVRDESETVSEVENLLKSLHWEIRLTFSKNGVGILCAEKSDWRPQKFAASS